MGGLFVSFKLPPRNRTALQLARSYISCFIRIKIIPSERGVVKLKPHFVKGVQFVAWSVWVKEPFNFIQNVKKVVLPRGHYLNTLIRTCVLHISFLAPRCCWGRSMPGRLSQGGVLPTVCVSAQGWQHQSHLVVETWRPKVSARC